MKYTKIEKSRIVVIETSPIFPSSYRSPAKHKCYISNFCITHLITAWLSDAVHVVDHGDAHENQHNSPSVDEKSPESRIEHCDGQNDAHGDEKGRRGEETACHFVSNVT